MINYQRDHGQEQIAPRTPVHPDALRTSWSRSDGQALVQSIEVGQAAGVKIGLDRMGEFGLAGAVMLDRPTAGPSCDTRLGAETVMITVQASIT